MRARFEAAWAALLRLGRWMRRYRASLLTGAAFVCGWALLTAGLASLTVAQVWPLSGGLFLLGLVGFGLIREIMTEGLYALARERRRE